MQNLAIIFGGRSVEHEVSVASAKNILESLDRAKYQPSLIFIDKSGNWHLVENLNQEALERSNEKALLADVSRPNLAFLEGIDIVFPVLHGPFGEDGTLQGLLELMNIPYIGSGVLGSALGIDKDIARQLLKFHNIPVAKSQVIRPSRLLTFEEVRQELGLPFFLKPARLGSSIGTHKVKTEPDFHVALKDAFSYDNKVLVEEYIEGREIECAVLGNENPRASIPGEVVPHADFYSYASKYLDANGTDLIVDPDLSEEQVEKVQALAVQSYQILDCAGLARVDFFLSGQGDLYVNEINTLPGFTAVSMYPKLWQESGLNYRELIDELVELALERFKQKSRLKTSYHDPLVPDKKAAGHF